MADTHVSTAEAPGDRQGRISYVPVKDGHPRFNVAVLLLVLTALLVLALVEAQRLSF